MVLPLVQDECQLTKYLERSCLGHLRHSNKKRKRKQYTKSKKKRPRIESDFVALEPSNQPSRSGGLVVGLNAVSRLISKGLAFRVLICGVDVSSMIQLQVEKLCETHGAHAWILAETSPAMLGTYLGIPFATMIGFEKKYNPEFEPILDLLKL